MLLFTALIWSALSHAEFVGDKFKDPDAEFSITKPADWEFVKSPKGKPIKLTDDSLHHIPSKAIAAFAKNVGKDFFGIKPTVSIERLALPKKMTPLDWLTDEVKRQAGRSKYYQPASPAQLTTIDQVNDGARAAFVNTTVIQGREVRVYHVIYLVPSGGKVFLVNMNCSEGLASQYVEAFGKIADSMEARRP
jgi:hypothetical protein